MSDSANFSGDSSDYEEPSTEESFRTNMKGVLSKWTNYILGWQDRYICCQEGKLFYYRSKEEIEFGCRGSINLQSASISPHEFDFCRFDVSINDSIWYLRASDEVERQQWVDVIEANKSELACIRTSSRQSSLRSRELDSSLISKISDQHGSDLRQRLLELDAFRDILDKHIRKLQTHFDECANWNDVVPQTDEKYLQLETNPNLLRYMQDVDFRGEAITFQAITKSIQSAISYCVDNMSQREEFWKNKVEEEAEKGKRLEEVWRKQLDCEKERRQLVEYKLRTILAKDKQSENEDQIFESGDQQLEIEEFESKNRGHCYSDDLENKVENYLIDFMKLPENDDTKWDLVTEEGEMKLYSREMIKDGVICDPLKAVHSIGQVTAREMCHYFWFTEIRKEWEKTVEHFEVVEIIDDLTVINYQTHRRLWPSAQRDCLYISSMLKVENPPPSSDDRKPRDTWMVCNFSIDHDDVNPIAGCVRALIEVALICQTYVTPPEDGGEITRDCLKCDIVYVANINPGGYAPASILRPFYKREYINFMRNFTAYVQDKTKDQEMLF